MQTKRARFLTKETGMSQVHSVQPPELHTSRENAGCGFIRFPLYSVAFARNQ